MSEAAPPVKGIRELDSLTIDEICHTNIDGVYNTRLKFSFTTTAGATYSAFAYNAGDDTARHQTGLFTAEDDIIAGKTRVTGNFEDIGTDELLYFVTLTISGESATKTEIYEATGASTCA